MTDCTAHTAAHPVRYSEVGPAYRDGDGAPDSVGPWLGGLAHVAGTGTLVHLTNRSRVMVLGAGGELLDAFAAPAGSILLPSGDGSRAWLVRPDRPVLEFRDPAGPRELELRAPSPMRSGLVVGKDCALLVTHDGAVARWDGAGTTPVDLPAGTPRVWALSAGPGHGYLAVHRKGCAVTAFTAAFERRWKFGGVAGNSPEEMSGPEHAFVWRGAVVATDTRNNRLIVLDDDGRVSRIVAGPLVGSDEGWLSYPNALAADDAGRLLVSDAGNGRLLAYDHDLSVRAELWGGARVRSNLFSYPRSAEPYGTDRTLVADSYHNRVVGLDLGGRLVEAWREADRTPFRWPRHAVVLHGAVTIVDSRNGRLVRAQNGATHALRLRGSGGDELVQADPHFLRPLSSGFLLSDTYANRVARFDRDGRLVASWGGQPHHSATQTYLPGQVEVGVKDCHDGLIDDEGTVWIVDTGNHRILRTSSDGAHQRAFEPSGDLLGGEGLSYPRSLSLAAGYIAIADAGRNRVLVCESGTGRVVWRFGTGERGLSTATLNDPRFVRLRRVDDTMEITVVDHGNHRLLNWRVPLSVLSA